MSSTKAAKSSQTSGTTGASSQSNLTEIVYHFWADYKDETPQKLKIIDGYLGYILMTGIIQFLYCALVGTFPFNSFLAGFIGCVGAFVLAVCLRIQINPKNFEVFNGISEERAFADFIFASVVLYLVVINFIG